MSCLLHVQEYMYEGTQIVINSTIAGHLFQGACRAFSKAFFQTVVTV